MGLATNVAACNEWILQKIAILLKTGKIDLYPFEYLTAVCFEYNIFVIYDILLWYVKRMCIYILHNGYIMVLHLPKYHGKSSLSQIIQ